MEVEAVSPSPHENHKMKFYNRDVDTIPAQSALEDNLDELP